MAGRPPAPLLVRAPWWFSAILAVIVYVGGVYVLPTIEISSMSGDAFIKTGARFAPLFAFVFLVFSAFSAVASFSRRRQRRKLFDTQSSITSIRSLGWLEFERLIGEAFRRQGYRVVENDQPGADGGVDLVLVKNNDTTLVQCKHWNSQSVGVSIVREILGVKASRGAEHAMVVTTGGFTRSARDFALENGIALYDGESLLELLPHVPTDDSATDVDVVPPCPKCGSDMVIRSRRGNTSPEAGFWGCSTFPRCRGTRSLS